jgi:ubiquinone/menaquinone biosynthesis C-methylase UbiE
MGNWLSKFDRRSRLLSEANTPWCNRRVFVLSRHLARAIPNRGSVLDVGAGDGQIAMALMRLRPDLKVEGLDIAPRPRTLIPVTLYDGTHLPFADKSFDYVTLVDFLYHTEDPNAAMLEAARVARQGVVIKDFLREGALAGPTLSLMDWVGNFGDFVPMPYQFLTRREWHGAFFKSRLQVVTMVERLNLYLPPLRWLFDRQLHFVAYLTPKDT